MPEDTAFLLAVIAVGWLLPMFIGPVVAVQRNRSPWAGFALAAVLGWVGVVLALFLPAGEPQRGYGRRPGRGAYVRRRRYRYR